MEATRKLRAFRVFRVFRASVIGLLFTLLWLLPNQARVDQLTLGRWLFPIFWLLFALTIYLLSCPPRPGTNFLGAVSLGFTVAATWYVTKINFFPLFLLNAYGKVTGRMWGFKRYLGYLIDEQLSPFYVGVFVLALLAFIFVNRGSLRKLFGRKVLTSDGVILVAWLVVPYLIFSTRVSTIHSRYLMPILPAVALLMARGLSAIPQPRVRGVVIGLVFAVAISQLFALSYDHLHWLRSASVVELPVVGQVNLFAHGGQNQLPNSGETDSRYWIVPHILDHISVDMSQEGRGQAELGLLINSGQMNEKHFLYLIYTDYPQIKLRELARNWSGRPAYPQLFEVEYVALSDSLNYRSKEESQEVVKTILANPPPPFRQAFRKLKEYTLPDDSHVYLYKRRYPWPEDYMAEDYRSLAQEIEAASRQGDALVLDGPHQINPFGGYYKGDLPLYLLPPESPLDNETAAQALADMAAQHDRLFAIFGGEEEWDPSRFVESWLNQHAYRAFDAWYGPVRLALYAMPQEVSAAEIQHPLHVNLAHQVTLLGYSLAADEVKPGDILRVPLFWRGEDKMNQRYKTFVHLLDASGQLVAQRDSEPVGSSRPTTTWEVGEVIEDHYGILIPEEAPPGAYSLVAGMYHLATGERLPIFNEEGEVVGDRIALGKIRVRKFTRQ